MIFPEFLENYLKVPKLNHRGASPHHIPLHYIIFASNPCMIYFENFYLKLIYMILSQEKVRIIFYLFNFSPRSSFLSRRVKFLVSSLSNRDGVRCCPRSFSLILRPVDPRLDADSSTSEIRYISN